ncbi:MAG: D-aminoacyl-tRNA deacylase [Candidatus Altiarchaeota archaeon]
MKAIAYSAEDVAGSHIARILKDSFGFKENGDEFEGKPVCAREDVLLVESEKFIPSREEFGGLSPELMVVASRHRSDSGEPTLTAHATGNFGAADIGGEPGRLSIAPSIVLSQAAELLKLNVGALPYKVSLEVTHHGPTQLLIPLVYVEVGSTERQWLDEKPCTVVAEVIDKLLFEETPVRPSAIGFGGPHYAPNFTEVTHDAALGHIAPKYAMEYIDKAMIEQMIERTTPTPELAVLDWKGLRGEEKTRVTSILCELGIAWKKTSELKA